jgi:WD40 repeat protein
MQADARLLAALLSDGRVKLYDLATLGAVGQVHARAGAGTAALRDVAFVPTDPTKVWVAASDGEITCWDFRTGAPVRSFSRPQGPGGGRPDKERVYSGPFSLAVSPGGDVLAAGVANELHLWDLRQPAETPLGVYTSSHAPSPPSYGTVRALAWHPCVPHCLVSGGDDGVVNVHDVSVAGEDDALAGVLSVGGAVASLGFFGPCGGFLWVATEFDGLSLWNVGSCARLAEFPALRMQFLDAGLPVAYLLGCHYDPPTGGLLLLAGGHDGTLLTFDVTPTSVTLRGGSGQSFVAAAAADGSGGGAQPAPPANTVRTALWARLRDTTATAAAPSGAPSAPLVVFTGDEDGRLCQWTQPAAAGLLAAGARAYAWEGEWDYARVAASPAAPPRATVDVGGLRMAAAAVAPGGGGGDAAAFGTRAADPVSDADENAPLGAEAAAIIGGGGGGRDEEEDDDDMGGGGVGGKRRHADDGVGGKKQRT